MNFDIDMTRAADVSPLLVAEAFLGVTCHGVVANEHVVQIMIPLGNIDEGVVNRINRMEVTFKGKTMRVDRISEGYANIEGHPYQYRSYGFCVPEAKRGPTEEDYRKAKSIMRDIAREATVSSFAPTSILLEDDERRSQEKMIVEAPVGSGRAATGFAVRTRQELGVK